MDGPVTIKGIESITNNHPKQKPPSQDGVTAKFYKIFRKEITPNFLQSFERLETEEILPNSFSKASIILTPKLDKENYLVMSLT